MWRRSWWVRPVSGFSLTRVASGSRRDHLPLGPRFAAALEIDALARLVLPVDGDRQVDEPLVALELAPDPRDVGLFGRPLLELHGDLARAPAC